MGAVVGRGEADLGVGQGLAIFHHFRPFRPFQACLRKVLKWHLELLPERTEAEPATEADLDRMVRKRLMDGLT